MRRSSLLLCLLSLAACTSDGPLEPGGRRDLDRAETLWAGKRPASYTYEIRLSCFCPPSMATWTEVLVRGDSITASRAVEASPFSDQPVPMSVWPTVPRLFEVIRSSADREYIVKVEADYDAEYGYPRRINVTCSDQVADCGATYETRNLKPVP